MSRLWGAALAAVLISWAGAAQADCNQAMPDAVSQITLAGHPFSAVATADGCTIFVSLTARPGHVAVLKRDNGVVTLAQTVAVDGLPAGMALSPDGHLLAVANDKGALLFDARALAAGNAAPLASLDDGERAAGIYVAFSPDGRLLVVANERSASLSLYDVSAEPRALGKLAVGEAPVGLAFSADGRLLYSTSEGGPRSWPPRCQTEGPPHPEGILLVFDVAKALADPKTGMIAGVAAGCSAVRVALSPDGASAYVTARGENAVHVFDTAKLASDATQALTATVMVGAAPVGVAVGGGKVFVTNSNRFGDGNSQSVSVLEATDPAVMARAIPAGGFPRELKLTADGNTLLVTNYNSGTLELVDLNRLNQATK